MSLDQNAVQALNMESVPQGRAWLNQTPALGIELEYEHSNLYDGEGDYEYWTVGRDGSLRNGGVELVSTPLPFEDTDAALDEVQSIVELGACIATQRCGLHTHMNVRPCTVGQMFSLVTTLAVLEPTIYVTYAQNRKDSMFAVPLMWNSAQMNGLASMLKRARGGFGRQDSAMVAPVRFNKYSGINTAECVRNFGTIELRQPYCSNNFDAIRSWIDFVKRTYTFGVAYDDPLHFLDEYSRNGVQWLQERLLGDTFDVDQTEQEEAEDGAYIIAGEPIHDWKELTWDFPILEDR